MADKIYLYPLWVRIWHMLNAITFLVLIATGLSMYYASPDSGIIPFDVSVSVHNYSGIFLCILFVIFIFGNIFTANGKYYRFAGKGLIDRAKQQFIYYTVGVFKNQKPPFPISKKRKFNPLQLLSYLGVMDILMPIVIFTGLALFFPEYIPTQIFTKSGIHIVDLIHITAGFLLSIFMIVHIYFCTLGPKVSSNFKSMINGWHEH